MHYSFAAHERRRRMPIRSKVMASAAMLASFTPLRALQRCEQMIQMAQGKGGGDTTVTAEVRAFSKFLKATQIPIPVVFDIGANVGNWTLGILAANKSVRIEAFEPSKAAFDRLSSRIG
jgi:hypothetical protein